MEGNITELERRYQALLSDYQGGTLDEATFVTEVDKLQFNDEWGRYWMLGAQSGAWHYYDGQAWHQADPRDADKLPFMDDQGRYWQKGSKSGDWYYFHSESGEWVKPGEDDVLNSPTRQGGQWAASAPADSGGYAAAPQGGIDQNAQFGGQLFQDDDGRYWAMGAKTGQWYFYDEYGWHPAQEFQGGVGPQMQQPPSYQPQPAAYTAPPAQPNYQAPQYYQQPYPAQSQQPAPVEQQVPPAAPQPQPAPAFEHSAQTLKEEAGPTYSTDSQPTPVEGTPVPPQGSGQSGTWYYHDGNQWLKYSTGEPADTPPPDPNLILDQEPDPPGKARTKSEPIVAEYFEEDEPPIEVVDVEVITVVEAEPDPEPEPKPAPAPPAPKQEPAPAASMYTSYTSQDEVRPRRSRRSEETAPATEAPPPSTEPQQELKRRTPSDPVRPVTPRKKAAAHEPTIIIPTGATASGISSSSSPMVSRPPKQRTSSEQRRAHDATIPMAPVPLPGSGSPGTPAPMPVSGRHRQVTQSMPAVARTTPASRVESNQVRTQRARQVTEEIPKTPRAPRTPTPAPAPATRPVQPVQPQKEGYTFGELLRSFPSTFWTWTAGIAVLLIFAVFLIIAGAALLPFNDNDAFGIGVAAAESPTPTLDAALPDSTPTPGPTPTPAPDTVNTSTPAALTSFSSPNLGFTLEYPENWQVQEDADQAVFSPSEAGLDPVAPADSNIHIGLSSDNASGISDLLADILSQFPSDAETLNEGTISIASQTWTSTQIRFNDENMGGQAIATLAVTNKDGVGYYLVAAAPAEAWNSVQPLFQGMINSFRFSQTVALSTAAPTSETITGDSATEESTAANTQPTPIATDTPQPQAAAVPNTAATPVVHIVKSGDTLIGIAIQYGVDVDLLASENGITDPGSLSLGQELTIPFTAEELAAFIANNGASGATQSAASSGAENAEDSASTESTAENVESPGAGATTEQAAAAESASEEAAPGGATEAAPISGKIVYPAYNPGKNSYDLWMVDLATGEQTGIASDASQPAFNKDGSLLAYRSWDLGTRGIFFRDFVGGRGGKVTNFVEDGMPAWSPDGFSFAFSSRKEGDRVPRIYIGNQLGEDPFGLAFQGEYPSTFPDGRLVVKGCTPTGDCGIFTMGASGGGEKKISSERSDTAPAPSPDGSKIAFMSNGRGGNNWEIWVMNADGSNPQRLTENGSNEGLPTWSPDGQSIAYVSDQGGVWGIWVMNADGSNQRKVVDMKGSPDGVVLRDEPNSRGWLEERISWAP